MLPTTKTKPKAGLAEFTTLIHGMPKIGKSRFVASAPDVLFLPFEAGLGALSVYQPLDDEGNPTIIESWKQFLNILGEIKDSGDMYKTLCIDTVEIAYQLCLEYICKKNGISHPGRVKDFGASWKDVSCEFARVLNKLIAMPQGLFIISHSKMVEINTPSGPIFRTVPDISEGARKRLTQIVDTTLFFDMEDDILTIKGAKGAPKAVAGQEIETRVIRANPSKYWEAGSRAKQLKNLPDAMPMEFDAFAKYFEEG